MNETETLTNEDIANWFGSLSKSRQCDIDDQYPVNKAEPIQLFYDWLNSTFGNLIWRFKNTTIDGKTLLESGFDNEVVEVLKYPISDRYCQPGKKGTVRNGQINVGGAWFDFDERWLVRKPEHMLK